MLVIDGKYNNEDRCCREDSIRLEEIVQSTTMKINVVEKIRISSEEIVQRIVDKNSDGKYHHDQ
jgi:hypothetical protein